MTTARMVVVLRSELGNQFSLAHKEAEAFKASCETFYEERDRCASGGPITKNLKTWMKIDNKVKRIRKAIDALGSIQLGDIEDVEL